MPSPKRPRNAPESASLSNRLECQREGAFCLADNPHLILCRLCSIGALLDSMIGDIARAMRAAQAIGEDVDQGDEPRSWRHQRRQDALLERSLGAHRSYTSGHHRPDERPAQLLASSVLLSQHEQGCGAPWRW
jgi:hypothetical protein